VAIRNARLVESIERDRRWLQRLTSERRHLRHEVYHRRDEARAPHVYDASSAKARFWRAVFDEVTLVVPADHTPACCWSASWH
jgi:hypothetical protein